MSWDDGTAISSRWLSQRRWSYVQKFPSFFNYNLRSFIQCLPSPNITLQMSWARQLWRRSCKHYRPYDAMHQAKYYINAVNYMGISKPLAWVASQCNYKPTPSWFRQIAFLYLDYFITFSKEIEFVWPHGLSRSSLLFFFNRYLALTSAIVVFTLNFLDLSNEETVSAASQCRLFLSWNIYQSNFLLEMSYFWCRAPNNATV
jgi:hypothetical protein